MKATGDCDESHHSGVGVMGYRERIGQEIEIRHTNNSFERLGWKRRTESGRGKLNGEVLFCFSNGRDWRKFKCMCVGSSEQIKKQKEKMPIDSMRFPRW